MNIVYASGALRQLDEIWEWNRNRYGADHADRYFEFLDRRITALAKQPARGHILESRPKLRHFLIRRKSTGHGHIVVYASNENALNVLFIFHSAQDWLGTVEERVQC